MNDFIKEKLGVLVTAHPKQHIWMDQAFASWAGYPGKMLLGYDHTDIDDLPIDRWRPPVTETFVTGKPAGQYGHFRGELWQMKIGGRILAERGCEYIYKTAADNCCYRWRNLLKIYQFMTGKHFDIVLCGTTQMFAKIEVFNACMDIWSEKITRCGGAELFMNHCIRELKPKDCRMKIPWWHEILGLIHLQGEFAVNTGITIFDTWAIGQKWGRLYSHADLDKRVKFLKPHIKEQYERAVQKDKEKS